MDRYHTVALGLWSSLVVVGTVACAQSQPPTAGAQNIEQMAVRQVDSPRLQRARTLVDAKAMTLRELVEQADRIVVGKVETVREATVELSNGGQRTAARVREVQLRVQQALKGSVVVGEALQVRQLASLSSPLAADETVMWFLPADSALGLTQPLGLYSGDFRIDVTSPEQPATNLTQNEGLWEDSLWVGEGFERARVMSEATATLKLAPAARTRIDNAAARDPLPTGVPLDLLVSATLSQVKR